jgi:hypothetical protein
MAPPIPPPRPRSPSKSPPHRPAWKDATGPADPERETRISPDPWRAIRRRRATARSEHHKWRVRTSRGFGDGTLSRAPAPIVSGLAARSGGGVARVLSRCSGPAPRGRTSGVRWGYESGEDRGGRRPRISLPVRYAEVRFYPCNDELVRDLRPVIFTKTSW